MSESEQQHIFKDWLDNYQGLIFKVVRAYAFTLTDQEDLFQDITLQVWRSVPNYKRQSAVSTWLYRVALNTALNWTRKERRHQTGHQPLEDMENLLKESPGYVDERIAWLYEEIARLNTIDRSLCLLLLDGLSYREMAQILGISESNIGVKIHRIKKYLSTQAKKYTYHEV